MVFRLWPRAACLAAWIVLSFSPTTSHADRFYLSERRLIEGILIHEDARTISFQTEDQGLWTLSRSSLHRVERESPGRYWIRMGDRHIHKDRLDRAEKAFRHALKDPNVTNLAHQRLQKLQEEIQSDIEKEIEEASQASPLGLAISSERVTEAGPAEQDLIPFLRTGDVQIGLDTLKKARRFSDIVRKYAKHYEVDPMLVKAIIAVESKGNPHATSRSGAQGLMQLMPETAKSLGVDDPYDPDQNIRGGVKYLQYLDGEFDHLNWPDRVLHMVAAYHAGPTRIKDVGDYRLIPATFRYTEKVMGAYERLKDLASSEFAFLGRDPKLTNAR